MAKTGIQPYYEKHRQDLKNILRKYEVLSGQIHLEGLEDPTQSHFFAIDAALKFPLRPYQREALAVLNEIFGIVQDDRAMKGRSRRRELIEDLFEEVNRSKVPFTGFEMATGSGKTLVMGAGIALLAQRFGIRNFIVLVGGPASSNIYQKTIRNFTIGHRESIWDSSDAFPFNLVTGENYREAQGSLRFGGGADVNIFVFNIQKFTETSGQIGAKAMRTQKPWESAPWKDKYGNTISIHEFLQNERLVIVTDEAHHTQGSASQKIIKSFAPEAVLEFTATANEQGGGDRRAQDIVYKYDIRAFLDEGYGKLIHALPLDSSLRERADTLDDYEKRKLITTLLIHLVKREALARDAATQISKAVCLIKVKDNIESANRVLRYVREELAADDENLSWILEKMLAQKLEVLERFRELWVERYGNDKTLLIKELVKIAKTAIGVFDEPDKETRQAFEGISSNDVEVIVYIKMLDEGIDLPNIYTMAVVNDNQTDMLTSIKQIIGRGVRLNKETRQYDSSPDNWLRQAELLHVVCDRGAAFENVIAAIQSAFGLTDRHIIVEKSEGSRTQNRVKRHLLESRYWPELKADLVVREGVKLLDLLGDIDTIFADYIDTYCFYKGEVADTPMLKFKPSAFFVEVDIFADPAEYKRQLQEIGAKIASLSHDDDLWKKIYSGCLRQQTTIPDIDPVRAIFRKYRARFEEELIGFYYLDDADPLQARKQFAVSFSWFLTGYVEKRYYRLDVGSLGEDGMRPLVNCFGDEDIVLPLNIQDSWKAAHLESVAKDMIKYGYPFRGYGNNAYEYLTFDSWAEKRTGDIVNGQMDEALTIHDARPVWIKNNRKVYFSYGRRHYYPDFLICVGERMYILETKGEIYSDSRKNQLLAEVEKKTGGKVKAILAYNDWIEKVGYEFDSLDNFLSAAEADSVRREQTWELEYAPPESGKFVDYLPVFSPDKAWRQYIKKRIGIRPEGWAKTINSSRKRYAKNCFALRNRSNHLAQLGPWLVIDTDLKPESGENALLHYSEFDDEYRRGFSVRNVQIGSEQTGGLFTQEVWILGGGQEGRIIRLRPPRDEFEVIGTVVPMNLSLKY